MADPEDLERCAQMVEDEIVILQSIYPEEHVQLLPTTHAAEGTQGSGSGRTLRLVVDIDLPGTMTVHCRAGPSGAQARGEAAARGRGLNPAARSFSGAARDVNGSAAAIADEAIPPVTQPPTTAGSISVTTSTLPSLGMEVYLPPSYPLHSGPVVKRIWTERRDDESGAEAQNTDGEERACWLPAHARRGLACKLGDSWRAARPDDGEGEGVLWGFMDWIASGEFVRDERCGLNSAGDDITITTSPPLTPLSLSSLISASTSSAQATAFASTSYTCGICLDARKGRGCIALPACGCVFCEDCLRAGWELAIREGSVGSVGCPSVVCTKARVVGRARESSAEGRAEQAPQPPDPSIDLALIERVVGKTLRERFEWLREKQRVENDPSYTLCPMQHCQAAVPPPPPPSGAARASSGNVFRLSAGGLSDGAAKRSEEEEREAKKREEDRWDRFRQCPTCQFCFCRYCMQTWHGPHTPCPLPSTSTFLKQYLSLPDGSKEKAAYERRYGAKQLAKMVSDWEEAEGNRKWMEDRTRICPGCQGRIEKSVGCNHMICSRCACHFCFRCSHSLRPSDPYAHYRTPGSSCFEKLFDQSEIDRFEREMAGGGGGGVAPGALDDAERFDGVDGIPWALIAGQGDDDWPE